MSLPLNLHANAKSEDLPQSEAVVLEFLNQGVVTGAELVERAHGMEEFSFMFGHGILDALPDGDAWPQPRAEPIVSFGVAFGLACPEFITEDGVEVDACGERIDEKSSVGGVDSPGREVLLEGHCQFAVFGVVPGYVAEKQRGVPLTVLAVDPHRSCGCQPHVSGKLKSCPVGREGGHEAVVTLKAFEV